uniref:DUF1801 domain-containing protein n=1 Tax=Ascaris lumbricoides TaxID=6252 RepID=A0A0M3IDY3_ASCLU
MLSDVPSLSSVDVSRLNATLTPIMLKKVRRFNDISVNVFSDQSSEAFTDDRKMITFGGTPKGVRGRDTRSYMLIKASPWEMPYHDASSVLGTDASISIYVSDSFEFEAAGAISSALIKACKSESDAGK